MYAKYNKIIYAKQNKSMYGKQKKTKKNEKQNKLFYVPQYVGVYL